VLGRFREILRLTGRPSRAPAPEPVYVREREAVPLIDGLVIPAVKAPLSSSCFTATGFDGHAGGIRQPQAGVRHLRRSYPDGRRGVDPAQESLALMDIAVERNAYGRQIDSRRNGARPRPEFQKRTAPGKLEAVFIRAPVIRRVNGGGQVLARYEGDPVLWSKAPPPGGHLHPELTRIRACIASF